MTWAWGVGRRVDDGGREQSLMSFGQEKKRLF